MKLLMLSWLICGIISYIYGAIKSDSGFYGIPHLLFIVLCGPIGLLIQII